MLLIEVRNWHSLILGIIALTWGLLCMFITFTAFLRGDKGIAKNWEGWAKSLKEKLTREGVGSERLGSLEFIEWSSWNVGFFLKFIRVTGIVCLIIGILSILNGLFILF